MKCIFVIINSLTILILVSNLLQIIIIVQKKYTSKIGYCKNDLLLKNTHNFSNKFVFLKNYPYYSSLSKYHEKYLFQTAKYLLKN